MDLFYNRYGTDGPPLLLLHGLLGANGNWHTLSRTAFQTVASVYAIDQRNHGRSPHTERLDYPSMAADVKDFVEQHEFITSRRQAASYLIEEYAEDAL